VIRRGIKLTGIRREILSALVPGRSEDIDELKRRVALGRGLEPRSPRWPSFGVSFPRALRLLEERGVLTLGRAPTSFDKPCITWITLPETGERERARILGPGDMALPWLEPESEVGRAFTALLARATDRELDRLASAFETERARRASAAGKA
jgi:hypothetical protein